MRIAFVGGFAFSPKGTVRARAHPLAAQLVSQGHEVTIFLTPYDNVHDSGREWVQDGVRIRNMGTSWTAAAAGSLASTSLGWLGFPKLLWQLIRRVQDYGPDVIHVFKPKGFAGAAGTYFIVQDRCPVVVDCDDWEGWGGWNDVKPYPWFMKEYIDQQERWMMKSAPALTVASRVLQDRARQRRGINNSVYYVPNCATSAGGARVSDNVQLLSQADLRRKWRLPEDVIVLYSGHFGSDEDVLLFCRAAARVVEQHRASIVFSGDGPDISRVKGYFASRPHIDARFFPYVEYQDFLEIVHAADIAAFPYRDDGVHRAKCSARMVDYMSMGKAVLTSAVGQNCEYIEDGESGLLAKADDEADFAEKLKLLVRERGLRGRLGRNAQARIRERFCWDGEPLRNCLAAYEHVLQKR